MSSAPVSGDERLFGDPAVDEIFGVRWRVQAMLDVEAALAEAEAACGLIPSSSVAPIRAAASVTLYDLDALAVDAAEAGNLAMPLVTHLTREVERRDLNAAGHVHWGATSQDVLDTALVLQLRAAVPIVLAHVEHAVLRTADLAGAHADTVMPGRTLLQQATPVTFGLKAAGWCAALDRQRSAVASALGAATVLQFGGASGTLASLGDAGPRVAERLGFLLGLDVPELPWHAHRDRLVRLGCALGVLCGTCGKVARDLALLAQTEVGEAAETRAHGGGSSAMPHKRNPVGASVALAASLRAPGLVATLLSAMPQEHERGLGGWHAEWSTLPELARVSAGAARAVADALDGLSIDAARMSANLDQTRGLVLSEAVTMALAAHIGRRAAFHLVQEASRQVVASGGSTLADALAADPAVTRHLSPDEIRAHLAPDAYLGATKIFIARVLEQVADEAGASDSGDAPPEGVP